MSRIITFYSYKGGVGRTFALANIAVLLAKRGKRVLVMDWDLEAPGLHRYFKPFVDQVAPRQEGLIHLLGRAENDSAVSWKSYVTTVTIPDCAAIHLIPSGDQASDYVQRVRGFSWNTFFEIHAGGDLLNRWRDEWKASYDFVLVDSRTGITDTGGVCTIYLPDILVLVFSANEQSFERGVQIVTGVQKARRDLAVPRPPLAVLPLPGRFDGRDEVDEAQFWLNRFAEELKPFYDDWLPKGLKPRQILELTKIPYITKFSFGEPLPVITQGTTDPEFPGFYLENVTRLLHSDFEDAQSIVFPDSLERSGSIAELRAVLAAVPPDEDAIAKAISAIELQTGFSGKLAEFLIEAGIALFRQQRFGLAESYLRRALITSSETLGASHPITRSSVNSLAELLFVSGRLNEAEKLYRQVLDSGLESDTPGRLTTYTNLANLCRQMGRLDEALSWYQRALTASERVGEPAALALLNNLAGLYQEMGRSDEAVEWYQRALQIGLPDDPTVLATYNNLASLYQKMGRNDEAVAWYRRALQVGRSDDPALLATYNNLASLYQKMGRIDEAVAWFKRALQIGRLDDPALLATYNNLAALYQKIGQSDEAIDWYRRALEIGRPDDPALLATFNNLAALYHKVGQSDQAIEWYRHALQIGRSSDPAFLATYNNLAALYQKIGRSEEAVECYQHALRMTAKSGRPGDTAILSIYNNLGTLYRKLARHEEAIDTYMRALDLSRMSGRPADSTVMSIYSNLAGVYKEAARHEEAIHCYEQALFAAQRIFGAEAAQTASQMNVLADALIEAGRVHEAEPLLRQALDIHLARRGKKSPATERTRRSLARLLEASGRIEQAKEIAEIAEFDVFISYGVGDSDVVRELAMKLSENGVSVWFDQWELRPGESIDRAYAKAISSSASYIICIGRLGPRDEMQAELFQSVAMRNEKNRLVIPILLPDGDPAQIPVMLRAYHFLDLRSGLSDEGIQRLVGAITRQRRKA